MTDMPLKKLTPLRKIIAARMVEAKQTIPHYRMTTDITMDAVMAHRASLNAERGSDKISVNDYIIKAIGLALLECPEVNIQFADNAVHHNPQADISVVIAVEGGLSTPVIRAVEEKSLADIAGQVKSLVQRAQQGQLTMEEITGGGISLSNLGMYGIDKFDAIINAPQCAIVAVGSATLKPAVINKALTMATVMTATASFDHRTIDGAVGAVFLSTLKALLEKPTWASV